MKGYVIKLIVNFALMRTPLKFLPWDLTKHSLTNQHHYKLVWWISIVLSIVLSVFLFYIYQVPILWCVVLYFLNVEILPIFFSFIYRVKDLNYQKYFNDNYSKIRDNFNSAMNSVVPLLLISVFGINVYNNHLHGGSPWEPIIDIFFYIYAFIGISLFIMRRYLSKKHL